MNGQIRVKHARLADHPIRVIEINAVYFHPMMYNYDTYGMMGVAFGGVHLVTLLLLWALMILGIMALWKYISKK